MCASALRRDVQKTRKNVAGRAEFQMQRDPERLSRAFDVVVTIISGKLRTPYGVEDVYKKAAPGIALEACPVRESRRPVSLLTQIF